MVELRRARSRGRHALAWEDLSQRRPWSARHREVPGHWQARILELVHFRVRHQNPMDEWKPERVGRYRRKVPRRIPRAIPDQRFNELFAALPSNRDRALVAFWISTAPTGTGSASHTSSSPVGSCPMSSKPAICSPTAAADLSRPSDDLRVRSSQGSLPEREQVDAGSKPKSEGE